MDNRKELDFLNSELWIKYTQKKYIPIDDIKYKLENLGLLNQKWFELKNVIKTFRKKGSISFYLKSIDKYFWYYPSDSITKKIYNIEKLGNELFNKLENNNSLKKGLMLNASIEEAITSSIYEGANSTRVQAKKLIASQKTPINKDEQMLINNVRAMEWIKENFTLPISKEVILQIHKKITDNILDKKDQETSGIFRNDTVFVAKHEGIDHVKIVTALTEVIQLITNHPRFLHSLIKGILLHYFIAYIHPFFDGNGRTARTLFYFQLMKSDLKFVEFLSISADLKNVGKKYENSFELVKENELDMTFFIDNCLESLITALDKVKNKINNLDKIKKIEGINDNQINLLQTRLLEKYKKITIQQYALDIKKSREIARRDLKDLFKKGFLKEHKLGKKNIYYIDTSKLKIHK